MNKKVLKAFKWQILMLLLISGPVWAAGIIVANDFNEDADIAGVTTYVTGCFTWSRAILTDTIYNSSPKSLSLQAGGKNTGSWYSYFSAFLPLGGEYDIYANGGGEVSVQVSRRSKASNITVELRNGDDVRASAVHTFTDWGTWHTLTIPLDGDETDIDTVVFRTYTYQNTSSGSTVDVDDLVIVPEPATSLLLISGLGMLFRNRRK